jgi:hypothetical protein
MKRTALAVAVVATLAAFGAAAPIASADTKTCSASSLVSPLLGNPLCDTAPTAGCTDVGADCVVSATVVGSRLVTLGGPAGANVTTSQVATPNVRWYADCFSSTKCSATTPTFDANLPASARCVWAGGVIGVFANVTCSVTQGPRPGAN